MEVWRLKFQRPFCRPQHAMSKTGTVIRWIARKGFGFIVPDDSDKELFCHKSNCWVQLRPGVRVSFDVRFEEGKGKFRATNVSLVTYRTVTYRTFSVDICKPESVPLGVQARRLHGGEELPCQITKVHKASPIEEWNRMSARTFPDGVLQAGDIITKYCTDDTSLPTTNGMENVLLIVVRRL